MIEAKDKKGKKDNFKYLSEQFADVKIIRYQIPGFENLTPKQKELVYYLYQAALSGRDILWDQNYKHNLKIRKTLEAIVENYNGDRKTPEFEKFMVYTKRVWFSNGIHHHYSTYKFTPEFSKEYFASLVKNSQSKKNSKFVLPLGENQNADGLVAELTPILFDPAVDARRVNQDSNTDLVKGSAANYYEGVSQKEVEEFYNKMTDKNDPQPVSYGLNSKLVKENGQIVEKTWKVGGMYSPAIERIVYWLEKAVTVAENDLQKQIFSKLIEYYKTGDLKKFNEYNILWVKDTESVVDAVNGFIEDYGDPLGMRAAYESVVSI
ncbi:MAG: dipeptidyl-peptidase 3 family protein, partial [Bacteroidota bacterium]